MRSECLSLPPSARWWETAAKSAQCIGSFARVLQFLYFIFKLLAIVGMHVNCWGESRLLHGPTLKKLWLRSKNYFLRGRWNHFTLECWLLASAMAVSILCEFVTGAHVYCKYFCKILQSCLERSPTLYFSPLISSLCVGVRSGFYASCTIWLYQCAHSEVPTLLKGLKQCSSAQKDSLTQNAQPFQLILQVASTKKKKN